MCEFSTRLIAWLDDELPDGEAAEVEQHVRACCGCRDSMAKYKDVSGMVRAYCEATLAAKGPRRTVPSWAPVLGAAASLAVLLAVFAHSRVEGPPVPPSTMTVASAPVASPEAVDPEVPARKAHVLVNRKPRRSTVLVSSRSQGENLGAGWVPAGPAIEIAIPGEEVLPPGALPAGVGFVADVSIAMDGSAQRLRLRPQLTGIERGPNQ